MAEFIAGPENRLAVAVVRQVVEGDMRATGSAAGLLSPLVLYGATGCGKSHLARGLADWWQQQHPDQQVVVLYAAEFAQQYAAAVDADRVAPWRQKLRACELLVIDDLAELVGKRAAQQELRSTLDVLSEQRATVVVTSPSLPQTIAGLSPALRSRFAAGLCVPIVPPSAATRRVMIEHFAAAKGIKLNKRVAASLADSLSAPAPMLLGALMELDFAARRDNMPIDLERIRRFVESSDRQQPISPRDIALATAKYFGLKLSELKSPSRKQAIVTARNVAIYLIRQQTKLSLDEIGTFFGGRDHTTILHGCRRTETLAKSEPAIRQAIAEIKRLLARQ